jgi:catechol 2,3-dioxygenase-like lactoylglutathione lyase family enzyme
MSAKSEMQIERLARVSLNSADPTALAKFFTQALGFTLAQSSQNNATDCAVALMLGVSRLDLNDSGVAARPYPVDVPGWNPLFQHIAIVTTDMQAAIARLKDVAGWTPISTDGPQHLPPRSGGVTAFKFRDPEGHPLELISFPEGSGPVFWQSAASSDPCLGIDHSATSVTDTQKSVAFYTTLGLTVGAHSLNTGIEQQNLDAVTEPVVEVTALTLPREQTPHVELLCYRGDFDRAVPPAQINDIAATRLVFTVGSAGTLQAIRNRYPDRIVTQTAASVSDHDTVLLRDPDGHLLQFESGALR